MNSTFKKNALKALMLAIIAIMAICVFASCGGKKECKHDYEDTVVSATCTAEGYTLHKCKKCGDEYTDTKVAKTEHNYTEKSVTVATCQTEGERTLKCNSCGDEKKETLAKNPDEHRYVHVTVVHPTCTEGGYTTHKCDCGASYKDSETAAKNHSYTDIVTAPTCTAQGYTTHKCNNCEHSYVDTYVAMTAHSYTPVVTPPTCKEQGYTTYTCSCNKSYVDNYTAIRPHDWDDGTITTNPGCLIEGEKTFTCKYDDCDEVKTESVEALQHNYSDQVIPPTCEAQGYTLHTCTNGCGHSYKDTYVDEIGHEWPVNTFGLRLADGIELTKPATCEEEGIITYTCQHQNCGATKEEKIAPLGHDTDGNTAEIVKVLKAGETCVYIVTYTTPCHNDGCSGAVEVKEEELHNYYWKITTEATCQHSGEKVYTCSVCGEAHPTEAPKSFENAEAHTWVAGETKNGVTTYKCACGAQKGSVVSDSSSANVNKDAFVNADSIELPGAELEFGSGVSDNLTEGEEISIKAETLDETAKNDALNKIDDENLKEKIGDADIYNFELKSGENEIHDLGDTVVVKIKYTFKDGEDPESIVIYYIKNDGTIEEKKAEYSNGYAVFETDHFSYYTVVRLTPAEMCAKLESHDFVDTVYDPTCIRDGYTIRTCARCGHTERTEGDKAYGHNHIPVITEPTCNEMGYTTYTCENPGCTHSYVSDYTDKLGHVWDDGRDVSATCKEKGYTVYCCENEGCEASYTENFTEFADHSWNNGSFTKTPTCTDGGTRTYKCNVCEAEKNEYVEAYGHKYQHTVIDPTCISEGYTLHKCSNCDTSYKDTYTAIVAHEYKNGVCKSCEKVCSHTFGAYAYNNDATCTGDGTETASCTECDVKDTRTKAGTAKGHSYTNGICSACGDGCQHNWSEYTQNGDATCENDGTKSRECSECGTKETVADTGSKLQHVFSAGVCTVCNTPCEHEYENGVCKHCEMSENNFYATFISSILTSNSFCFELEDFEFVMNALNGTDLNFSSASVESAKMSVEFVNGEAIIKMIANGSYAIDGNNVGFNVWGVTHGGLFIIKIEETYANNQTIVSYNAMNVDISALNVIFGEIKSADISSDASPSDVKNILMTKFPNTIGNLFGNLLETVFKKTPTENGYTLTFDAENLHELNNLFLEGSLADVIDIILGDGAFEEISAYLVKSLNKDVKVVISDICEHFVKNDRITAEEMEALLLIMTEGESISSIPDMTVKEFFTKMMNMPTSAITKEIIKYAADRFTELSAYDLISLITSMNGIELEPKDIHALVGEYIDLYADFGKITINTDKAGNFISMGADAAFDMAKLPLGFQENIFVEGSLSINASISRNKTFDYDFSAIISEYKATSVEADLTKIPESLKDKLIIVNNGDGTYTLINTLYSYSKECGKFNGTYNGKSCIVVYSEDVKVAFTATFSKSELVLFNKLCLEEEGTEAYIKYLIAPLGEISETVTIFERFYDNDGTLLYENKLNEESESASAKITYAFIVDNETKNLIDVLTLDYIQTHNYRPLPFDISAYTCGSVAYIDGKCAHCNAKNKVAYFVEHDIELKAELVENGESCDDGVIISGVCSDCDKTIGKFEKPVYNHIFEDVSTNKNLYSKLECIICDECEFALCGDYDYSTYYVDENEIEHFVDVYTVNTKAEIGKPGNGFIDMNGNLNFGNGIVISISTKSMVDCYENADGDYCIDYYINVILNEETQEYTYDEVHSFVIEAVEEEPEEYCDHNVYSEPETTETTGEDGSVTTVSVATATCPVCEAVIVETYTETKDSDENLLYSSIVKTVDGVKVYEETYSYVYINGEEYITEAKMFDTENGINQSMEAKYDALGNVVFEARQMTMGLITNYQAMSYAYDAEGEQIVIGDENKMLYNGKLIAWISNAYEGEGCAIKVTTTYYNSDGTVAFSTVEENVHQDLSETYTLLPSSKSCHDGYLVTVYCNACNKTVDSYIEKSRHPVIENGFEGMDFRLEVYSCLCGNGYDYNVIGSYSYNSFPMFDEQTKKESWVCIYMFESGEALIRMNRTETDAENCVLREYTIWYYAENFKDNVNKYLSFSEGGWEITGVNTAALTRLFEALSGSEACHELEYIETTEEKTENGITIVIETTKAVCKTCKAEEYTSIVKTTVDADENILGREEINILSDGSTTTYFYDADGNCIRSVQEFKKHRYVTEYKRYDCGFFAIEYEYYNGELYNTSYYFEQNHNFDEYYYEYLTPGSDSCDDGIYRVYVCTNCGMKNEEKHNVYYGHETSRDVLWSHEHGCKNSCEIYKDVCLCGAYESEVWVDGNCEWIEIEPVEGKRIEAYKLTCYCGEFVGYCMVESYSEPGSFACETKQITVYYCGASLDELTEIYRVEELVIYHEMGEQETDVVNGTAANGNESTTITAQTNCLHCDHNTTAITYDEHDADGNHVYREITYKENGVVIGYNKSTYVYDEYGNQYPASNEVKNQNQWYKDETAYDFDSCSFEKTITIFNEDGSVNDIRNESGSCHIEGEIEYVLAKGESCDDGVILRQLCARCEEVCKEHGVWGYNHYYKNAISTEIIETACGKLEVSHMICPCGAREDVNINSDCEFSHFKEEYANGAWNNVYRCMVTDCAYTYSVENVYEMEEGCMRSVYQVYRFGIEGDDNYFGGDCDYSVRIFMGRGVYHDTDYITGEHDGYTCSKCVCKNCGLTTEEYHTDANENLIYSYSLNDDGTWRSETFEYDEYGRQTLYHRQESSGYWYKYYYEYNNNSPCEYVQTRYFEDEENGRSYQGEREFNNHSYSHYWLSSSCTQHNTTVSVCVKCGDQYFDYASAPTCHNYVQDDMGGYRCTYCGLLNETGVNGYFILEDLTNNYPGFAAGFYFPNRESVSKWELNFFVTITDKEGNTREAALSDIDYIFLEVNSSGTVIIDMTSYEEATKELLSEGEQISEFIFSFAALDEDSGTYLDHRLTVDIYY